MLVLFESISTVLVVSNVQYCLCRLLKLLGVVRSVSSIHVIDSSFVVVSNEPALEIMALFVLR